MVNINLKKVSFPQQLEEYKRFTTIESEIHALWNFDINLKIIFIKYSLIIEQILKSKLLEVIEKEKINLEKLIQEYGPVKGFKNSPDFKHVPESFAKKTYNVIVKKGLDKDFKFYNMIELSSFSQFLLLIENINIHFRDKLFKRISQQTNVEWNEIDLLGAIRNAVYLRNICAHNGNLLNPKIKSSLMSIGNVYTVKKAMDNLTAIMNNTNAEISFREEYLNLYLKHRKLLKKLGAWI